MPSSPPTACPSPADPSKEARLIRFLSDYGDGADGLSPTPAQWKKVLDGPARSPITVINFFKLRGPGKEQGETHDSKPPLTGAERMMRYAAVSGPALERVGGHFLLMAPVETSLMGDDEDWDLVAIGKYPSRDALLTLFEDAEYVTAFADRRAALDRQRVWVVTG